VSIGTNHSCTISSFALSEFALNVLKSLFWFSTLSVGFCALNSLSCGDAVFVKNSAVLSIALSHNQDILGAFIVCFPTVFATSHIAHAACFTHAFAAHHQTKSKASSHTFSIAHK